MQSVTPDKLEVSADIKDGMPVACSGPIAGPALFTSRHDSKLGFLFFYFVFDCIST